MKLTEEQWDILRRAAGMTDRIGSRYREGQRYVTVLPNPDVEELVRRNFMHGPFPFADDGRVYYQATMWGVDACVDHIIPSRLVDIQAREDRAPDHLTAAPALDRRELLRITSRLQARLAAQQRELLLLRAKLSDSEETRRQENALLTDALDPELLLRWEKAWEEWAQRGGLEGRVRYALLSYKGTLLDAKGVVERVVKEVSEEHGSPPPHVVRVAVVDEQLCVTFRRVELV